MAESTATSSETPLVDSNTASVDSTKALISINAAAQLPLKLTSMNYPSWRAQFNALLFGYDLMGYMDGSQSCPPKAWDSPQLCLLYLLDAPRSTLVACYPRLYLALCHNSHCFCQNLAASLEQT
ncbi:hypothetical protein L1049_027133 [Liquidambar formosana]|uniref:Retrotransposon Copia-like N-terminal domain-containing protein n=1 Tax=Liquidambar formosana TaxID=63359 RepID=A0AAP0N8Y2_LIQFO